VLQRELAKHSAVSIMRRPHHNENETLYWSKAAAVLDLPQPPMIDSSILPMSRTVARAALERLLHDNLDDPGPTPETAQSLNEAWHQLTVAYGPVFLEKSPHHLHSRPVLELLLDAQRELTDVEFRFVGLVRNPIDTMYSMWKRWKTVPETREREWCRTYENLLWLEAAAPDTTQTVRYEDLIADPQSMSSLLDFIGVDAEPQVGAELHGASLQSWRADSGFGYQPGHEVRRLATRFGYSESDLNNTGNRTWPVRRTAASTARRARTWVGTLRKRAQGG
jgi:hypothetical protein